MSAVDAIYTMEPRRLNEFGDTFEFVVYGEERCAKLGIEDDAEMAMFLFQAFDGTIVVRRARSGSANELVCSQECLAGGIR